MAESYIMAAVDLHAAIYNSCCDYRNKLVNQGAE